MDWQTLWSGHVLRRSYLCCLLVLVSNRLARNPIGEVRQLTRWEKTKRALRGYPNTPTPRPSGWVVVKVAGGIPARWFRWHKQKIWEWTPDKNRAFIWQTYEAAEHDVSHTSMAWRELYEIQKTE